VLNDDELEALFDPAVYVSELDGVFHRLEKLEVAEPELGPELEPGRPT